MAVINVTPTAGNSIDLAYHAAQPQDTIVVTPGFYDIPQTLTHDASKIGLTTRIVLECAGVTLTGMKMFGVQHLEVRNLTNTKLFEIRVSNPNGLRPGAQFATDLVLDNLDLKVFLFRTVRDVVLKNSVIGNQDVALSGLSVPKIGGDVPELGYPQGESSMNVTVEDCVFENVIRSTSGTGVTHCEGIFFDAGCDGIVVQRCFFTNNGVFDIFSNGNDFANNRPIQNITIQDCLLDVPRDINGNVAASAINFKGGAQNISFLRNSILGSIRNDEDTTSNTYPGWTTDLNAIGVTSGDGGGGPTDVVANDPGFVSMSRAPCNILSCYDNDLHITASSVAGLAGAGVPEVPSPDPNPPDGANLYLVPYTLRAR